jgi:hypothetical protein
MFATRELRGTGKLERESRGLLSFGAGPGRREARKNFFGGRCRVASPAGVLADGHEGGALAVLSAEFGLRIAELSVAGADLGFGGWVGGVDQGLATLVAVGPAAAGGIPVDAALGVTGRVLGPVGGFGAGSEQSFSTTAE